MFNFEKFFIDNNINFSNHGKNISAGWQGINCPFCPNDNSWHLGIPPDGTTCFCWKCGKHSLPDLIVKLLRINLHEAYSVIRQYGGQSHTKRKEIVVKIGTKKFKYPSDIGPMQKQHKQYLEGRGFNAEYLQHTWGLLACGVCSLLDGISYKHRILAPIFWEGKAVSFQCRDWTGKSELRYITAPRSREIYHHKHILYGKQECWGDSIIVTEGITDVWRFGPKNSVCTFGIEYRPEQVRCLKKFFKRVFIAFDDESQAQAKAQKLRSEMLFRGIESEIIPIVGDPGALDQNEANIIVKEYMRKVY